jgi:sterol desaturase/sphingolipid hydroxylase (fatty acid hydroxylase superfamily)
MLILPIFITGIHYFFASFFLNLWIGYIILYIATFVGIFISLFYFVDHYVNGDILNKIGVTKTHNILETLTEKDMIYQVSFNLLTMYLLGYAYFADVFNIDYNVRGITSITSFPQLILELCEYYLVYDMVFYYGHRILHLPKFYPWHKKHHRTYGTIAMSAMYMTLFDFFLEAILPFYLGPILFNGSKLSLVCWGLIGSSNTLLVHSGYMIPYVTDDKHHYQHHTRINGNYSIYVMDKIHRTEIKN